MSSVRRTAEGLSRAEWIVVILVVASVVINYIDRSNLSIAAPMLQKQLSLSPLQMGSLLSAFSFTYAFLQLFGIAGWFSDRFPVGRVLMLGYLLWSTATILTGLVSGFALLYSARLLLGAGESIAYPCYSRIFAELPQQHRGRANALVDAGTKIGPAVGAMIGGLLLIHFGWRALFIVLGVAGLAWIIPWAAAMTKAMPGLQRTEATGAQKALPSTWEMLGMGSAWGSFLGHFCGNYYFYFLLVWLPIYLVQERKISLGAMTRLNFAVFFAIASATLVSGWISDHLIARGASPTRVRKSFAVGGLSVASTLIGFAFIGNMAAAIALLFVACLGYGAFGSQHWAISQTLAGPAMAGRWTSIQNGIGNLAGIAAPWIAGAAVQITHSSRPAFFVSGMVALAGAFIWGFMVPKVEQVRWKNQTPATAAR